MYKTAADFYRSKEWVELRSFLMASRVNKQGEIICAECGKPIVKRYDCIAHHIKEITLDNLNDANITLNPSNIELLHASCHNKRHARFGYCGLKRVYLVYGCPLSGKSSYVRESMGQNDIKVDIDDIFACISNNQKYYKPDSLLSVARAVYDNLLDQIKTRRGKWQSAYIIGGFPFKGERERVATEYGAEEIFIECDKDTAMNRLACCDDGRDITEWSKHIDTWFSKHTT